MSRINPSQENERQTKKLQSRNKDGILDNFGIVCCIVLAVFLRAGQTELTESTTSIKRH